MDLKVGVDDTGRFLSCVTCGTALLMPKKFEETYLCLTSLQG